MAGGGSGRGKSVGERERGRAEREDVHIWSCSTFTGGSAPHTDQYVDLLEGGGGGKGRWQRAGGVRGGVTGMLTVSCVYSTG